MPKFIPLALFAMALPVVAQAQEDTGFTVEGQRFFYNKTQLSPQTYKVEGRLTDGRWFRLSVKGRRVSGDFDGKPVYFVMPRPGHTMGHPMLASPA